MTMGTEPDGQLAILVGDSEVMREVRRSVKTAAPFSVSVLIIGETGTGKEMVARAIHRLSPRADRPFVVVNCSAIPESLTEKLPDGGTLLLDEISEMPVSEQGKLLHVFEDEKVRVIASTVCNPELAVSKGELRQDVFLRLNVFHIQVPPLREHKEDLPALVEHLLRDINQKHGLQVPGVNAEVLDLFKTYHWPGNVRELRNVLERAAITSERGLIAKQHLPANFGRCFTPSSGELSGLRFPIGTTVDAAERELILQTLAATNQNKTRAAELLGISLKTLHNKLKEYESPLGKSRSVR